jgi:methyl-accepting chemotaxis protein
LAQISYFSTSLLSIAFMFWNNFFKKCAAARHDFLGAWQAMIGSSLATLRQQAGATENEFLQIGEQMEGVHQRSGEISRLANHLVDVASGQRMQTLLERLRQMMRDMEDYLAKARKRAVETFSTLHRVQELLAQISKPLEGFQKMDMTLHILGVSIKIESARFGEMGSGFVNLAMDVETLARQVKDKSDAILKHRQLLTSMITENMAVVQSTESVHDAEVASTLGNAAASLRELESVNERFTQLGGRVAGISSEIGDNIGEVVSSMQFHDINRQQVEHIVEALERLSADISSPGRQARHNDVRRSLIIETGDVCELQEAQLCFAATKFHAAVSSIVGNLRDVAGKQTALAEETLATTGVMDASDPSFLDRISRGMSTVTALLTTFADTDRDMSAAMKKVAATIGEITVFATEIEAIGYATVHIALNAQIKAAHTGEEGAALEVLAKEIKQLSSETVRQTDAIAMMLTEINSATAHLAMNADDAEINLGSSIKGM